MADPRGRRIARQARQTGTPEDLALEARERQRRGEEVLPWELLPVGWVIYKAWQLGPNAKVEAIGPDGSVERFYVLEHPFPAHKYPRSPHPFLLRGAAPQMRFLGEIDDVSWSNLRDQHDRALFDSDGMAEASAIVVPATLDPRYEYEGWPTVLVESKRWEVRDFDGQPNTTSVSTSDAWRNVLYAGAFSKARVMSSSRDKKNRLRWKNPADPRRRQGVELDLGRSFLGGPPL